MLGLTIRSFAVAAALLLAFPAVCAAQSDAPVARPDVKPGDRWVYRRTDFWTNKVTGTGEVRVVFANDKEHDQTRTSEWNEVSSAFGGIFEPHSGFFKFPLQVGSTYKVVYDLKLPLQGAFHVKPDRTAKVVGWETVEVPAGKFRALKIEIEGSFQRVDTAVSGTAKNVFWYVPEVKRTVKVIYEDATFRGKNNWFGFELVEYKLQ